MVLGCTAVELGNVGVNSAFGWTARGPLGMGD